MGVYLVGLRPKERLYQKVSVMENRDDRYKVRHKQEGERQAGTD